MLRHVAADEARDAVDQHPHESALYKTVVGPKTPISRHNGYSHPAPSAKSAPVLSSLPHLLGGLLHFLLGYSLFDALDRRGILIGFFFALTFTAGHLNQEVRDHEGDRVNGLRTNAVFFGKERTFLAGLVLFMLAYADLAWLAFRGLIPAALGVLPLVLARSTSPCRCARCAEASASTAWAGCSAAIGRCTCPDRPRHGCRARGWRPARPDEARVIERLTPALRVARMPLTRPGSVGARGGLWCGLCLHQRPRIGRLCHD